MPYTGFFWLVGITLISIIFVMFVLIPVATEDHGGVEPAFPESRGSGSVEHGEDGIWTCDSCGTENSTEHKFCKSCIRSQ